MPTRPHLFVCTGPTCHQEGAEETLQQIHTCLQSRHAQGRVRTTLCRCLGQCGSGPNMVVYSAGTEGVWYAHVGPDDVAQIVDQHLLGGGPPVARLRHTPVIDRE